MNGQNLDPVSVLVMLAAAVFSPAISAVIGPYAVIIIGSTLGAYWALGSRPTSTRMEGLMFFLAMNAAALLLTVPLAMLAKHYLPEYIDERWVFGPMAMGIGLLGDRWPKIGLWFIASVRDRFSKEESPK